MPESEGQSLEYKSIKESARDIAKTACAFANAVGGSVIFGVARDGTTIGILEKDLDETQQLVSAALQQVSPVPLTNIKVKDRDGKKVVVLEVYQIGQGTFCTTGGIVYYRSGSTNVKMEGKTLQDYMVTRRFLYFDELLTSADLRAVDPQKVNDFLKRRSPELDFKGSKISDYLLNLGVCSEIAEGLRLKNAGVLFFARDPSELITQNEIKMVRFKGIEPVEILDTRYAARTIPENLKEAEDFIRRNTRMAFKIHSAQRREVPEYPSEVIREALVNALTHRDYFSRDATQINIFDDRIEFINPGTLPSGLTIQILGTLSIQRNPLIYRLMRDIGMVEGLATGIPRIKHKLRQEDYPEPWFEELGSFFRVTIHNKEWLDSGELNEKQHVVLSYLQKNPTISSSTLAKMTNVTITAAVSDLNRLSEMGLVKRVGKTRGAYYVLVKR